MPTLPKWIKPPKEITIEKLRELAAAHGQDIAVLVTWAWDNNVTNLVTSGSDELYAQLAVETREKIASALGLVGTKLTGDLRFDHIKPPNEDPHAPKITVSLTHEDLFFLLWLLGHINSAADEMDQNHKDFIDRYHDRLLPLFGNAYEQVGKVKPHEANPPSNQ